MAKKCAYFGCLLAFAVICSYVEFLLPINLGIPGIKLGLANVVAVYILYKDGLASAMAVNVARVLLSGLLFGNTMSVVYSLSGAVLSLLVMFFIKKASIFSTVGVSVAGAVFHNIGQLLAALMVIGFTAVMYYLPFLTIAGVITGFLIGLMAGYIINRVKFKF